jgi:hypothetical protein
VIVEVNEARSDYLARSVNKLFGRNAVEATNARDAVAINRDIGANQRSAFPVSYHSSANDQIVCFCHGVSFENRRRDRRRNRDRTRHTRPWQANLMQHLGVLHSSWDRCASLFVAHFQDLYVSCKS